MGSFGATYNLYSGTATGNGNTQSTPLKVRFNTEAAIFLEITAISGTLDITIQTKNPLTDTWHTLATFDQKSATGNDEGYLYGVLGEYIAVSYEVSDSCTFRVDASVK